MIPKNGGAERAENVVDKPQQQPYNNVDQNLKHGQQQPNINEDNKYKNGPTTSWTREEALTEEGLAFGVPYWDQVRKTEDLQIIDN